MAGEGLVAGSNLWSCDGRFVLIMQADGRLGMYQVTPTGTVRLWVNPVSGLTSASYTIMQGDGNLVTYAGPGQGAVWSTNTPGYAGAWFAVQNDGNLVVYDAGGVPRWASNTCCH